MKALRKIDNYRLYKVGNRYEIWHGRFNAEKDRSIGMMLAWITDPANFDTACHELEIELMSLKRDYELHG